MLDKIISKKKELTYKLKIHIRKKAIKQFEKTSYLKRKILFSFKGNEKNCLK